MINLKEPLEGDPIDGCKTIRLEAFEEFIDASVDMEKALTLIQKIVKLGDDKISRKVRRVLLILEKKYGV